MYPVQYFKKIAINRADETITFSEVQTPYGNIPKYVEIYEYEKCDTDSWAGISEKHIIREHVEYEIERIVIDIKIGLPKHEELITRLKRLSGVTVTETKNPYR